jgi:DNA-binding protein HU-beta
MIRTGSQAMNKAEFVEAVADTAELSKADAGRAVDAMIAAITRTLKKGDSVTLVGFGTFDVRKRGARTGRNPRTGEEIKIKASLNPAFKAGKALKDAVNSLPRTCANKKPR